MNRLYLLAAASLSAAFAAASAVAAPLAISVTDSAGKPVADAVVTVVVAGAPTAAAPGSASAQIAQEGRQFVPQVTVVQTGTAIGFPNRDTVRHHVYSFSGIKTFELKLYAGMPSAPIVFDKPGTGILGCNIHDKMTGWVVVVDTPYFAKTDAAGLARLDVPDGEHRLRVWNPRQAEPVSAVEQKVRSGPNPVTIRIAALPAG